MRRFVYLILAALLLAGCTEQAAATRAPAIPAEAPAAQSVTVRAEPLVGVKWVVVSATGASVPPGVQAQLTFTPDAVTGNTGCARISAPTKVGPDTVSVGKITLTEIVPCPRATSELHNAITKALEGPATYAIDQHTLRLASGAHGLILRAM